MFFREAKSHDLENMYAVRLAVEQHKESTSHLTGPEDYRRLLETGKGWVCEVGGDLLGFAMVDFQQARVETLLVRPGLDGDFIYRMLHDMMTSWCFAHGLPKLTLTGFPPARTEQFYLRAGWVKTGTSPTGESTFELENNLEPLDF